MRIDKTTLQDLSVFLPGGGGVFDLLDHTTSYVGRASLKQLIHHPPADINSLQALQDTVRFWTGHLDQWPTIITNGSLVMLGKFFESAETAGAKPSAFELTLSALFHKFLNRNEYFHNQFSLTHIADFVKGCTELCTLLESKDIPDLLKRELTAMQQELNHPLTVQLLEVNKKTVYKELVKLSYLVRRELKFSIGRLVDHYARIDAWQSLARATKENQWSFPEILTGGSTTMSAKGLYHPLLEKATPYDIQFQDDQSFMILTGANMSGKTTFMRALGVAALLAHIGVGVPAASMRISFLEGIITNMHVADDLLRGESYFFAEVQRMKQTAEKLAEPGTKLVLMDELFKGTNVHDAFECTRAVIEGLLHHPDHLMVLSTHLYEAADQFKDQKNILFSYFVTEMRNDHQYHFTYELKQGISGDRIGYRILQQTGVLDILNRK